jgi:phosphate transport system substrate-binding protein
LLVIRESGSGTNDFVLGRILQSTDFPGEPARKKSNKEIFDLISQNEGAISFINSNNFPWENKKIKYVKIKTYSDSLSVSPFVGRKLNDKAIRYGDYPLAHYLYLITAVDCPECVSDFINWVLSEKGQKIVKDLGLLSVKTDDE